MQSSNQPDQLFSALILMMFGAAAAVPVPFQCSEFDSKTCLQKEMCFWLDTPEGCYNVDDITVPLEQASCAMLSRSPENCGRAMQADSAACSRCVWLAGVCTETWDDGLQRTICAKANTTETCEQIRSDEQHLGAGVAACSWHSAADVDGVPSPHCALPSVGLGTKETATANIACCSVSLTCSTYKSECSCSRISPGCKWNRSLHECVEEDLDVSADDVDAMYEGGAFEE